MPQTPAARFACTACGKEYRNSNHLRRHQATHSAPESFTCHYCEKKFNRRDVLRKHYSNCRQNANHDDPPPAKRGKKRRACDSCFQSKVSCDGEAQCAMCHRRGLTCTYSRVEDDNNASSSAVPPTTTAVASPSLSTARPAQLPGRTRSATGRTKPHAPFLLGLTNPHANTMVEVFFGEPGRDDDAPTDVLQPESANTEGASDPFINDGFFFPWLLGHTYSDPSAEFDLPQTAWTDPEPTSPSDPILDPIVTALHSLHITLTTNDATYDGTFDPSLASQLFTRPNREAFVAAYFRHTHKDLPLIHRPSFDAETSAPALVLAVFLCGAQYCPPTDCVLAMPRFLRIADEWVFREVKGAQEQLKDCRNRQQEQQHLQGTREYGDDAGEEGAKRERAMYEALQAAWLMQGLIFVVNDEAARRRNWVARRPALVEVVRALGVTRARHTQTERSRPDWALFVREEVRIRIAIWPMLTDWHQAGMFHAPGLMTVCEMTGDLPCIEELWEANNTAEFEAVIVEKGDECWQRSASLRDCMDALMEDAWSGVGAFPQKHLNMLDLQIFIYTIHMMIGTARFMSLLKTTIPALQRACDRWQELWRAVTHKLDKDQLRMSGLMRHSGEFCWFAKALLQYSLVGKDQTSAYFQRIGHGTPKELHDLLLELQGR